MLNHTFSDKAKAYCGRVFHCVNDPAINSDQAWEYFEKGVLVIDDGYVVTAGLAESIMPQLPSSIAVEYFNHHLLVPGFIDTHIHYPQTEIVGAYGEKLLTWLETYTFPTELKFTDKNYAKKISHFFLEELFRNGTTTALVFGTSHKHSVHAFFEAAKAKQCRMICGKVMMDRHAPPELCDTVESSYDDSLECIENWHGVDRLQYAVTPRFAPTSTEAQLQKASELLNQFEGLYCQTHLSETVDEVEWVSELFPKASSYLDVYDQAGLLGRRSIFAHGIHLNDAQFQRLAETQSSIAHCPSSNLFLGSGLFALDECQQAGVNVSLATDIGGGTSFSMFKTMDEAYKIQQLRNQTLDPFSAFYLATLGGAKCLDINNSVGNFSQGQEADFLILNLHATPLLQFRTEYCQSIRELLFVLTTLGDDRLIERTYSLGECVYQAEDES